jgi:hypothetical protein
VGLAKFRTKINSMLPALPLSDLLPLIEETLYSTICNSSVHKKFKILVTSFHNFTTNTLQNGYLEHGSWIMEEWYGHSSKYDISFQTLPQDDISNT